MTDTGVAAPGLLAPFAYFQLSLIDVRTGTVVRDARVTLMQNLSVAMFPGVTDPWEVLDAAKKVERLQQLITQGLAEQMGPLLQGL